MAANAKSIIVSRTTSFIYYFRCLGFIIHARDVLPKQQHLYPVVPSRTNESRGSPLGRLPPVLLSPSHDEHDVFPSQPLHDAHRADILHVDPATSSSSAGEQAPTFTTMPPFYHNWHNVAISSSISMILFPISPLLRSHAAQWQS